MAGEGSRPGQPPEERLTGERVYDSFVVRLWREVGNPRLLRVEVAHAQGGEIVTARGVEVEWIGARIAGLLDEPRSSAEPTGRSRRGSRSTIDS